MASHRNIPVSILIVLSLSLVIVTSLAIKRADRSSDAQTIGQRLKRHGTSTDYESDYSDAQNCRCSQGQRPQQWRGSGRNNPSRGGYEYSGRRRGNGNNSPRGRYNGGSRRGGYSSRRRSNWWFDQREDYADEILVYRFYNGRNRQVNTRRRYKPGHSGDDYDERPIGSGGRKNNDDGYSTVETTESDVTSSSESTTDEQGEDSVTETSESQPIKKVKRYTYWAGIWEVKEGDEDSSPPTVVKYTRLGSISRTSNLSGATPDPLEADYGQNNCCYSTRGSAGGRRTGNTGRRRYSTKSPINFFGITWSKTPDDASLEADGRGVNVDIERDLKSLVSGDEQTTEVVEKEEGLGAT